MIEEFHALPVAAVRRETPSAVSFGLRVPSALAESFRYKPGQHVGVRAQIAGEEVRRTYSITSAAGDALLWITIKRVEDGVFSTWAHEHLAVGADLECLPPAGRLVLPERSSDAAPRRIVAVAAGSGITPIVGIIEQALAAEPDAIVTLIYGNRTVDDILFRERLEGLKSRNLERLQVFHVLSRDSEADVPVLSGRIDADKLSRLATLPPLTTTDDVLLCGPDTLILESRNALLALGAARERVRFEYFKAGPDTGPRPAKAPRREATGLGGSEVVATIDGSRRTFRVHEGEHVIDAAIGAGIRLPYSCKGGMCCTCRAMLVEGEVVMDRNFSLQDWEMEAGFVLTCQSRPLTPRIVLDYDRS
jgi:ring-1,2-phenylacetyl-CoA epoxidase subunit PaaE